MTSEITRRNSVQIDTSGWLSLELSAFSEPDAQLIVRYRDAISDYIAGERISVIEEKYGVVRSEIFRRLNRCAQMAPDGRVFGWRALAPRLVLKQPRRKKALELRHAREGRGFTGLFNELLIQHPEIASNIENYILKRGSRHDVFEPRIAYDSLHKLFKSWCAKAHVLPHQYPFNTKWQGYRTLCTYARQVFYDHFSEGVRARCGEVARSRLNVGRSTPSRIVPERPLDYVQMDPFEVPCLATVRVRGRKDRWIPIERLWVVVLADVDSAAAWGYSVSIRKEVKTEDMVSCIAHASTRWKRKVLTIPALHYMDEAGFPSMLAPELSHFACCVLQLDNAWQNLAEAMVTRVRKRLGCEFNFGGPRRWDRRQLVESINGILQAEGLARVPSTTGTQPKDPRKNDPAGTAIGKRITYEHLLELIEVAIANYNATPTEHNHHQSPLQYLAEFVHNDDALFWPTLPRLDPMTPDFDTIVVRKRIAGNAEEGRRPYIQVDRVKYSSPVLEDRPELIGQWALVHIKLSDLRSVRAFVEKTGAELGILTALGQWSRTPHSLQTRKIINSLLNAKILQLKAEDDPVLALVGHYTQLAVDENARRPKKISPYATKLAQLCEESGLEPPTVTEGGGVHSVRALTTAEALARLTRPQS